MGRDDERMRVRERLGALDGQVPGRRTVRGGRWDSEEVDFEESEGDGETSGGWDDEVSGVPNTPQWLSEPVGSVSLWHERLVPERFRGIRLHPGRRGVLVLGAVGVAAVLVAVVVTQRESPVAQPVPPLPMVQTSPMTSASAVSGTSAESAASAPPPSRPAELVVSVVGLVEHVGLLHLPAGSRVADAVAIAVAREGADLARLNLAQRLADGDQVIVGALSSHQGTPQPDSAVISGSDRPVHTSGASSAPAAKVNLNTATESELDELPGVGPATARSIIAWRTEHGPFTTIDQLADIPGLGPSRLSRLRDLVTL
ncbi:ComEA family DNA-binding protein [Nocardia miyunensis]|uniref:ComEA family DNA-binding protein n=1 Tax=Nocardia miyunensis TaxID=282684 RepID=UPI00083092ED|nr:ComEA family DNA-binding protein [Nocardia miyunensis]